MVNVFKHSQSLKLTEISTDKSKDILPEEEQPLQSEGDRVLLPEAINDMH